MSQATDSATGPSESASRPVPTAPTTLERWFPIAVWLRQYDWGKSLAPDLIAAVSVAALLIPESMGYASVAGVPAQYGLYAAPLALLAYAMFGGSRLLVFAAAGSVAAISASIVGGISDGDSSMAITLTAGLAIGTGVVYLVFGLAKMGWVANFISKAVMAGFIFGMSIQIIVGQFGKLFGVDISDGSAAEKLWAAVTSIGDWNISASVVGIGALLLIFGLQRFMPKVPAALSAVIIASAIVAVLSPSIDIVAEIPQGLPSFGVPTGIDLETWLTLIVGGIIVLLVGFSEGWGAESSLAEKTHDDLDTNQEFRAYGLGNLGAGLLGGMGVTGSLSKSSAAVAAGAKSQFSNILLAGFVILTLLFLAPLFQWLPETVLAAIVINAMSGSASPRKLERLWKVDRIDFAFALVTFLIVFFADLLPAMIGGIVMSVVYMIYRISFPGRSTLGRVPETGDYEAMKWEYGRRSGTTHSDAEAVPGVIVYRFASPLIFANAEAFKQTGQNLLISAAKDGPLPHTMVIDFEEVILADSTGTAELSALFNYAQRYGVDLMLARVHSGTHKLLELAGTADELGEERFYHTVRGAVDAAVAKHGQPK